MNGAAGSACQGAGVQNVASQRTLALNPRDALDILGTPAAAAPTITERPTPRPPDAPAEGLEGRILSALSAAPLAEDQLLRDLGLPAAQVAPALVDLELSGRVERQPGGLLVRRDLARTG